MPVRRLRTDQLQLVPPDGRAPITLFTEQRAPGDLATQDVFQVSPDGGYLAYASHGTLHVRAVDGSEHTVRSYGGQMRFSPDGRYLAALVGHDTIVLVEPATGATRELGRRTWITQLEWLHDGVVVLASGQLVELRLAGDPVLLLEGTIDRFAAAGTGTRVVAFTRDSGTHVISVDATAPATPHELRVVHDLVTNAAVSLDGSQVAFTTPVALFTSAGDARPTAIDEAGIHSVWFARDGRLGYASASGATFVDGAGTQKFVSGEPISMLRFDPLSAQALVASGERLGLDHFAGGYVVWTMR